MVKVLETKLAISREIQDILQPNIPRGCYFVISNSLKNFIQNITVEMIRNS
jgi:hypothetical protein